MAIIAIVAIIGRVVDIFGRFNAEKLAILEKLCAYYRELNEKCNFQSATTKQFIKKFSP
jgi:hypothetical protein